MSMACVALSPVHEESLDSHHNFPWLCGLRSSDYCNFSCCWETNHSIASYGVRFNCFGEAEDSSFQRIFCEEAKIGF